MKRIIPTLIFFLVLFSTNLRAAPKGATIVKLLSAGPAKAVVKYRSQTITVRKCFECASEEGVRMGLFSINMSLLGPCIGRSVMALIDKGEILSLACGERTPPVLVIPDLFLK